jgi:hypothetical protein
MNFKTTIILLLLVIVVGVYIFAFDRKQPPTEPTTTTAGDTQLYTADQFDRNRVDRVTIERGGETVVLERGEDGTSWRQTSPVSFPLSQYAVEGIIGDASQLAYTESFKPSGKGPSLANAGLEPPRATVTFHQTGDAPSTFTFKLGNRMAIGAGAYLMREDDPLVYVVGPALHQSALDEKLATWRNKSPGGPAAEQASRVTLTRDGQSLTMIKTDGQWSFAPPQRGRVSSETVAALVSAVKHMYLGEFEADAPDSMAVYGLAKPRTSLSITLPPTEEGGEQQTTTLLIGRPTTREQTHFYATWSDPQGGGDVVFTVSKANKEKFDKAADDLRDPRITVVKADDVNTLEIQRTDEPAMLVEHTDSGWTFTQPQLDYTPDSVSVSDLIDTITQAKADSFITDAPAGEPLAVVRMASSVRPEDEVLRIFAGQADDTLVVMRGSEPVGHVVATEALSDVFAGPLKLRQRAVIDLPVADLNHVAINTPDGTHLSFNRELPDGPWSLEGYETFEKLSLDKLLIYVQPLMAEQWLLDAPAMDGPVYQLTFGVADGPTRSVTIDAESHAATSDAVDAPFEISQSLIDAVTEEFRYRTIWELTTDDMQQVTVDGVAITKDGDDYIAEGIDLDQSAAGGLFDALQGLRAEHFIKAREGEPARQIIITTVDGATRTIDIYDDGASVDGRHFTLPEDVVGKLIASLRQEETTDNTDGTDS